MGTNRVPASARFRVGVGQEVARDFSVKYCSASHGLGSTCLVILPRSIVCGSVGELL